MGERAAQGSSQGAPQGGTGWGTPIGGLDPRALMLAANQGRQMGAPQPAPGGSPAATGWGAVQQALSAPRQQMGSSMNLVQQLLSAATQQRAGTSAQAVHNANMANNLNTGAPMPYNASTPIPGASAPSAAPRGGLVLAPGSKAREINPFR